jgi:diguanylate cyclase (GGDEF)-like protein
MLARYAVLVLCALALSHAARADAAVFGRLPADVVASEAEVVSGALDGKFVELEGGRFTPARKDRDYWVRIQVAPGDAQARPVLLIERNPIEHLDLFAAGQPARPIWRDDFFRPLTTYYLSSFVFRPPLSTAPQLYYLHVQDPDPSALHVRVIDERDFAAADLKKMGLVIAVLSVLAVMALVNLIFFGVLRDRVYRLYVAYTLTLTAFIMHAPGLVYVTPGLRWLAVFGPLGPQLFGSLSGALAVRFLQEFVQTKQHAPRMHALLNVLVGVLLAVSGGCVLGWTPSAYWLRLTMNLSLLAFVPLQAAGAWIGWREGSRAAGFYLLAWIWPILSVTLRILAALGLVPANAFTMDSFFAAEAAQAIILSLGLADRTLEFRKQRDRAQFLRDQAEARLRVEQARRSLDEDLEALVAAAGPGALPAILQRGLSHLAQVLPLQAAGMMAERVDGERLLLAEPAGASPLLEDVARPRVATLRTVGQSRRSLVITAIAADGAKRYGVAVLPLALPGCTWSVALLVRPSWQEFSHADLTLAEDFAAVAAHAAGQAQERSQLQRRAVYDALTGALNRGSIEAHLEHGFSDAVKTRRPYAALFIDLDHFKHVNDRFGHAVGDECLKRVAAQIRAQLGPEQEFGRYGGEEFVVALPGTSDEDARALAERIRLAIRAEPIVATSAIVPLTVSIGGSSRMAGDSVKQVLERADQALYAAKDAGRDRVEWAAHLAAQSA